MLHFTNLNFKPGDQLQVDLGYGTDTFTAADGPAFWTRPINIYASRGGVQITYIKGGAANGSVQLDMFGRGERHDAVPASFHADTRTAIRSSEPGLSWSRTTIRSGSARSPRTGTTRPKSRIRPTSAPRSMRSVGMIFTQDTQAGVAGLSTCSVTLIDSDKIITAGHCHTPEEALTSSVTFDYVTDKDGNRPAGYNPKFYKVKEVLVPPQRRNRGLQHPPPRASRWWAFRSSRCGPICRASASRCSVSTIPTGRSRSSRHPWRGVLHGKGKQRDRNDRAERASMCRAAAPAQGCSTWPGGLSGCSRTATRAVISVAPICSGSRRKTILAAIVPAPPPPTTRDVMVVFDRSGSMSEDDGTGRTKIEAARDSASLFYQLIKAGGATGRGWFRSDTTPSRRSGPGERHGRPEERR